MPLERANAVIQAVGRGARLLGSPLAGLLVALLGASRVLWFDAASFALSAALVGVAVPFLVVHAEARERYLDQIVAGLRFIRRERLILTVAATVAVTNFLESPLYAVALPVYVKRTFGSAVDLGVLMAAVGGGAMVGAIVFGALGARLPRRATFTAAFIVLGLPYWALAALPPLAVAAVALVVAGLAAGPINPILATVNQERVPAELRGRVFGTITALAYVATPLGVLLGGYAVEWLGLRATIAAIAAGYLLTTLTLLVNPALREMDARGAR
jgi:MFS family permease